MKKVSPWLALVLAVFMVSGCEKTFEDNSKVLAKVNGENITEAAYQNYRNILQQQQHTQIPDNDQNRQVLLQQMVSNRLVVQEAKNQGLQLKPDIHYTMQIQSDEVLISAVVQNFLKSNPITKKEIDQRYDELKKSHEYLIDHILVKNEELANKIIAELKTKKVSFKALAKKYSIHEQSKDKGGRIDWIGSNFIVPSIYQAADELKKPGLIDKPIQSKYGWHVVKVDKVRLAKVPPLKDIRNELVGQLQRGRINNDLLKYLRSGAKVEYIGTKSGNKS
jgi:peptidyl-prolyl cis-trans isomerase C